MSPSNDYADLQECMSSSWRDSLRCARAWLKEHRVPVPGTEMDGAAARAVLESAFRAALRRRLGSDLAGSVTVKVGVASHEDWYLSVFGLGIWTERFRPTLLFWDGQCETKEGGDRREG